MAYRPQLRNRAGMPRYPTKRRWIEELGIGPRRNATRELCWQRLVTLTRGIRRGTYAHDPALVEWAVYYVAFYQWHLMRLDLLAEGRPHEVPKQPLPPAFVHQRYPSRRKA